MGSFYSILFEMSNLQGDPRFLIFFFDRCMIVLEVFFVPRYGISKVYRHNGQATSVFLFGTEFANINMDTDCIARLIYDNILPFKQNCRQSLQVRSKMRKTALMTTILILFLFSLSIAQENPCDQAYIKAMTAKDASQKAKLLKDFLAQCAGKGSQYENFAHAELCKLAYAGKTEQETINHGEKALALGGLDDVTKYTVLVTVASLYGQTGKNLEKGKNYASQAAQIGQAQKNNQLVGAAHFVQGQILQKAKDYKGAVNAYVKSYNILKNKQIAGELAKLGKSLYDAKAYTDAASALKVANAALGNFGTTVLYAKSLHRSGNENEALKYYKQAYTTKKSGELAYNIGLILAKNSNSGNNGSSEAIKYLLEASFLSESNSKKAMDLAQRLFFNHEVPDYNDQIKQLETKNKSLASLTETFNNKFGEKAEEDLSDAEKAEMEKLLKQIKAEQQAIEAIQAEQQKALEKFQALIAQTKTRLGIS
jgi:tetratricopeptide (TPR) repeat protein